MKTPYEVTGNRHFSKLERIMIWEKPASHQTGEVELRVASEIKNNWDDPELKVFNVLLEGDAGSGKTELAKALSYQLQLPYTKVTCFADMDKSDVFGALLPVTENREEDGELLEAIYQTDSLQAVLDLIAEHFSLPPSSAKEKLAQLVERIEKEQGTSVQYRFYPSEILRALEKGYLLEIQEPTVIRDASVMVALNSALEANGMLNTPTGLVRRHPDCVVVITTNRNYQGTRPLNESLRDRMQHAEKMDLPPLAVMMERAVAKTGFTEEEPLEIMARSIRLLEDTAKANAIKGVAGMRSYFYWTNSLKQGQNPLETLYPKVLYKLTTEPNELSLLEDALETSGLLKDLASWFYSRPLQTFKEGRRISQEEADVRNITTEAENLVLASSEEEAPVEKDSESEAATELKRNEEERKPASDLPEIDKRNDTVTQTAIGTEADDKGDSLPTTGATAAELEKEKQEKRQLNQAARKLFKDTIHAKEGLIIHRPKATEADQKLARTLLQEIRPKVAPVVKKLKEILENEESVNFRRGQYTGTRFDASRVAYEDFRTFEKKNPPQEAPSLAIALRIDESGSMVRQGRLEAARKAGLSVLEFSKELSLPLMVYGDTADLSSREKTSIYSYKEFSDDYQGVAGKMAGIKPRQNNRDGVPLRILADSLSKEAATTKVLFSISDGQPKAMPDYTGKKAKEDIQQVIADYERQGIIFLAAAIGEDQEIIREIYGEHRFLDITDLQRFPEELVGLLARYLD
ncbi:AAA family ATPase [Enterococcus asini]|uniref:AAA family ATPase n=1 Tax=Enterococcus asini TaxID=57732 RepID=UPI00288CD488|nr:AAA family ATPase [Enterococcus asini]MDT2757882.1 AAA family ATPase [Enterococcus asini]